MSVWKPIQTVPIDTPVIVTDGQKRCLAMLKSQQPKWVYDDGETARNSGVQMQNNNFGQFEPKLWTDLPEVSA